MYWEWDLDEFFREFERQFRKLSTAFQRAFEMPRVDVYEEDGEVVVLVDLPGVEKSDIEVYAEPDRIYISARRKKISEERGENYIRRERFFGSFKRVVPLPFEIDVESVKASYKDGVLEIRARKVEGGKGRKVEIE